LGEAPLIVLVPFIAILKDDSILIVENKDAHLHAGAEEKKNIGNSM